MNDLRFALRQALARPLFTALIVGVLALGIGATTAIFSVLLSVLLDPLPYAQSERLVAIWESQPQEGVVRNVASSGNYLDWLDDNTTFESLAAYSHSQPVTLGGVGPPSQISVVSATPSLLPTLGVQPLFGEPAREADQVLLSYDFWQRRFGGAPDVVGRTFRLDDSTFLVTGVMAPDFTFPDERVQLWRPLLLDEATRSNRRGRQWKVIGRLSPGISIAAAESDLRGVAQRIRETHPDHMRGWSVNLFSLKDEIVEGHAAEVTATGGVAGTLWLIGVVVLLTLLIACVNVAGLMLARFARRRHELAVRKALGAGERRLIAGVFAECGLYAAAGAAVGTVLAYLVLPLAIRWMPIDVPRLGNAEIDAQVLAFACVLAGVVIALVGWLPARAAAGADPAGVLGGGARAAGAVRARWRHGLIVTEVALACVLTTGALLLTHDLVRVLQVESGYDNADVQVVQLPLPWSRYGDTGGQVRLHERVIADLRARPGVLAVSGTAEPPVIGYQMTFSYAIEGVAGAGSDGYAGAHPVRAVAPGYFETMGQQLVTGRAFEAGDRADSIPVAIVNEAFARRYWPDGRAPIGERLSLAGSDGPWLEIVGVAADTRHDGLLRDIAPAIYLPYAQKPWPWMSWMYYVVRSAPGHALTEEAIRASVAVGDPDVAIGPVRSLDALYSESSARSRLASALLGAAAVLALFLCTVGLYGVIAYSVVMRQREFGVRLALGATRGAIRGLVVITGFKLVGAGLLIGVALSWALGTVAAGQLHFVDAFDPVALSLVSLVIAMVAMLASSLPAMRAAATRPMEALRDE